MKVYLLGNRRSDFICKRGSKFYFSGLDKVNLNNLKIYKLKAAAVSEAKHYIGLMKMGYIKEATPLHPILVNIEINIIEDINE